MRYLARTTIRRNEIFDSPAARPASSFADGRGGVSEGLQEAAHRRPGDRLGGDRLSEPDRAPVRLYAHAGHLHPHQPQGAASAEAAFSEGERHTRSGGGEFGGGRARH